MQVCGLGSGHRGEGDPWVSKSIAFLVHARLVFSWQEFGAMVREQLFIKDFSSVSSVSF